jgi:hypothetical protein
MGIKKKRNQKNYSKRSLILLLIDILIYFAVTAILFPLHAYVYLLEYRRRDFLSILIGFVVALIVLIIYQNFGASILFGILAGVLSFYNYPKLEAFLKSF